MWWLNHLIIYHTFEICKFFLIIFINFMTSLIINRICFWLLWYVVVTVTCRVIHYHAIVIWHGLLSGWELMTYLELLDVAMILQDWRMLMLRTFHVMNSSVQVSLNWIYEYYFSSIFKIFHIKKYYSMENIILLSLMKSKTLSDIKYSRLLFLS